MRTKDFDMLVHYCRIIKNSRNFDFAFRHLINTIEAYYPRFDYVKFEKEVNYGRLNGGHDRGGR